MIPTLAVVYDNNEFIVFSNQTKKSVVRKYNTIETLIANNKILVCNKKSHSVFENHNNVYDIMELFVLLYPLAVCAGTPLAIYKYLCAELQLSIKKNVTDAKAIFLILEIITKHLLQLPPQEKLELIEQIQFVAVDSWSFVDFLLKLLSEDGEVVDVNAIKVWHHIPEYQSSSKDKYSKNSKEVIVDNNSSVINITTDDIINELSQAITHKNSNIRLEQKFYAQHMGKIFQNIELSNEKNSRNIKDIKVEDIKNYYYQNKLHMDNNLLDQTKQIVFAEAGTGTGKTLGYLSAIVSFLKKNPKQQVLISTYSKALQKQIMEQFEYFFSGQNTSSIKNNVDKKAEENISKNQLKATIIKGSGNYVCLLNFQHLLDNPTVLGKSSLFIAIMARWLKLSKYGDVVGGDLNPLAFDIFSNQHFNFLANKGEECIHSKCKYFKNCFVMKAKYLAKNSNLIISNHSYSLINKYMGIKYVLLDEAHHLFNSADEIFVQDFSVSSLRRIKGWIQGYSGRLSNAKASFNGIKSRISFIMNENKDISEEEKLINYNIDNIIDTLIVSCDNLPSFDSLDRIQVNMPRGVFEDFLYHIYVQVNLASSDINKYYSQEMNPHNLNLSQEFYETIIKLKQQLQQMQIIANKLTMLLINKMNYGALEEVSVIEEFIRSFDGNFTNLIVDYIVMLDDLLLEVKDQEFIYRFVIQKDDGQIYNIGYYKNYVDPSKAMAEGLSAVKGLCFTSATLTNSNNFIDYVENNLLPRFGINYLDNYNICAFKLFSPFNYHNNTKIILINQQDKNIAKLSYIIHELFQASGGGSLVIFTAIMRLKEVYNNIIKETTSDNNFKIMAQHVNNQKLVNLIDVFKEDINSCLLATDAARDGVDIPGHSLRMVIFEKIPWAKPDILLKEREKFFGKSYSEELTTLKLKQAFGRLIRTEQDKGVFVLIDKVLPSKFLTAFPEGVKINSYNLKESTILIKDFLA